MKKLLFFVLFLGLILPGWSLAAVGKPQNVSLSPGVTTIAVSWTVNSDDTSGYYVSWGLLSGTLDSRYTVSSSKTNSYTIHGLSSNTTYYVKVTAFNSGNTITTDSDTLSSKTLTGLAPPSNFFVTSIEDITETSIGLSWERPDMDDLSGYTIYYKNDSDSDTKSMDMDANLTKATLSNLQSGARYNLSITSLTESGESAASPTLIVDTAPDTLPPQTPSAPDAQLTGDRIITITIKDSGNGGMADLKGYQITVTDDQSGRSTVLDVGDDTTIAIGEGTAHEEISLENGALFTITVKAYDQAGNESGPSPSSTVAIEGIQRILIDSDGVQSGCFIGSLKKSPGDLWMAVLAGVVLVSALLFKGGWRLALILLPPLFIVASQGTALSGMNNAIGIKAGYFKMSDPLMKETFEDRFPVPVRLYYERTLHENLHVDIDAGFLKLEGNMLSTSGETTEAQNTFIVMPTSLSFTYNHYLTPFFYAYMGAGLDHWYVREEIAGRNDDEERQSHHVGGYHYKCGIAYLTQESAISQKYGIQLEAVNAIIDRFGRNDRDLGGFTIQAGYFYRF